MRVMFRIDKDGVYALLPEHLGDPLEVGYAATKPGEIPFTHYADLVLAYSPSKGYHTVVYTHRLQRSRRATTEQYAPLLAEMEAMGNTLRIVTACSNAVYRHRLAMLGVPDGHWR